jgi:membrane protein DedA with SNARE-associated domain
MLRLEHFSLPDLVMSVVNTGTPWLLKYGLWAVALGMFAETLVLTGLVVPGVTILITAGYLIASGILPLFPTLLVACLATIGGDQASYWLGYYWGAYFLRKKQAFAGRLGTALESQGVRLLLIYHYASRFRCLLPCVVGSTRYDAKKYFIFDSIGACIWVSAMLIIGYSAHGVVHSNGTIVLYALSVISSLLMFFTTIKLYRQASHQK